MKKSVSQGGQIICPRSYRSCMVEVRQEFRSVRFLRTKHMLCNQEGQSMPGKLQTEWLSGTLLFAAF